MHLIQQVILITICINLIVAYRQLYNINTESEKNNTENFDKNSENESTKSFANNSNASENEHEISDVKNNGYIEIVKALDKCRGEKNENRTLDNENIKTTVENYEFKNNKTIELSTNPQNNNTAKPDTTLTTSERTRTENLETTEKNPKQIINTVMNRELSTLANTGHEIKIERSKANDSNATNHVGMEILKNMTTMCGYYLGKRISFGRPTTLMQYPWTVLLVYNTHERYHCGGSLITFNYVLTAAHCVSQVLYELTSVRLGEHDISTEKDCAENIGGELICSETIDVGVDKIIVHHEYSQVTRKNDIALLRLDQTVGFSRSYYPICLPKVDEDVLSQRFGTVAGWGATEKSLRSNILLMADVPVLDMSKCRKVYGSRTFNDDTEMCGSGVNEIDVCQGDSGGAIFYELSDRRGRSKYYQMGIISLGVARCGDSRFLPAVFTKLPAFIKWIENNLEN